MVKILKHVEIIDSADNHSHYEYYVEFAHGILRLRGVGWRVLESAGCRTAGEKHDVQVWCAQGEEEKSEEFVAS